MVGKLSLAYLKSKQIACYKEEMKSKYLFKLRKIGIEIHTHGSGHIIIILITLLMPSDYCDALHCYILWLFYEDSICSLWFVCGREGGASRL